MERGRESSGTGGIEEISQDEVKGVIGRLKMNKASGVDDITGEMLRW